MFNIQKKEMEWGGKTLSLETGRIARQADGAVLVTYGDTVVLCTAVSAKSVNPGFDFFPLTVHYQERTYAAGKIPGGFFKREAKPSEKETLVSRLIDRPIRPLFAKGFKNETQVICTVLAYDESLDSDIAALVGASAALTLSGVPFEGPIGAAKVAYVDGEYYLNPNPTLQAESDLNLTVAGTQEGVLMVESEASELSEEIMLGAVKFGHEQYQPVIDLIVSLAETAAKDAWDFKPDALADDKIATIKKLAESNLRDAYKETVKQERVAKLSAAKKPVLEHFSDDEDLPKIIAELKNLESSIVRNNVLETKSRIDGRKTTDIRNIVAEVDILPKVHGSCLFTRGETQAICVATLGTSDDEQIMDNLAGEYKERFLLHYNFPPYSVGEAGRMGPPGRREIGHGKLAWRALNAMLPTKEDFPYTIRLVSEITESNGSSSMATVCSGALAMMDAGVPIKKPVAGIAMGLIKEDDNFAVLSDILGDEDHLGDMDFKVTGTAEGVTALQMDIKITSITPEIMQQALQQAKEGRLHILDKMAEALTESRQEVNSNAPRIETIKINKDKIRDVIGSGGKVIREICETTGARIDIEEDGTIRVAAVSGDAITQAIDWIKGITEEAEVGKTYTGKVVKIMEFGAFVNFMKGQDGLVHVSEIANYRVNKVTDELSEGQEVKVKCIGIDDKGRVKLSIKALLPKDEQAA